MVRSGRYHTPLTPILCMSDTSVIGPSTRRCPGWTGIPLYVRRTEDTDVLGIYSGTIVQPQGYARELATVSFQASSPARPFHRPNPPSQRCGEECGIGRETTSWSRTVSGDNLYKCCTSKPIHDRRRPPDRDGYSQLQVTIIGSVHPASQPRTLPDSPSRAVDPYLG